MDTDPWGEGGVTPGTDVQGLRLQALEGQTDGSWELEAPPPRPSEGAWRVHTWMLNFWPLEPERISSCGFKTPGLRIFAEAASEHAYNSEGPEPIPQTTVSVRVRGEGTDGCISRHNWWGLLSGDAPPPERAAAGPRRPAVCFQSRFCWEFCQPGPPASCKVRPPGLSCPSPERMGGEGRQCSGQGSAPSWATPSSPPRHPGARPGHHTPAVDSTGTILGVGFTLPEGGRTRDTVPTPPVFPRARGLLE